LLVTLLYSCLAEALYSYVERATRQIASVATSSKIVVEKSTVPCRTAESMRTILEANSRPGCRFDILSNPEFLAEGTAITDLHNPDRVLIGSLQTPEGKDACESLATIYANWVSYVEKAAYPYVHVLISVAQAGPNSDGWLVVF
jgi:UDP-glucose 6-dehydrogenase